MSHPDAVKLLQSGCYVMQRSKCPSDIEVAPELHRFSDVAFRQFEDQELNGAERIFRVEPAICRCRGQTRCDSSGVRGTLSSRSRSKLKASVSGPRARDGSSSSKRSGIVERLTESACPFRRRDYVSGRKIRAGLFLSPLELLGLRPSSHPAAFGREAGSRT